MAKDYAALQTALENDARYDADVVGGSNSNLIALLNEEDPAGGDVWLTVSVKQVREVIASAIPSLSALEVAQLRILLDDTKNGKVDGADASVRAALQAVLAGHSTELAALVALARRRATYGQAFGFDKVKNRDLWQVLPLIAKSHHARYLAGTV